MKLVLTFAFLNIVLCAINAQFAASTASAGGITATAVAQVPHFGAHYPQQNYNYNYGRPGYYTGQYNNGFNVGGFGGVGGFNGAGWHMPHRHRRPPHHPHLQQMAPQHHVMPHQPNFNVNHPNYYNHNYIPAYPNQNYPDTVNTNPHSENQPTQTNIYPNQNYPDTINTNPNIVNQPTQANRNPINQQSPPYIPPYIPPVPTKPTFIDLMDHNRPKQTNPQSPTIPTNPPNNPTQTNSPIISPRPQPQPAHDSLIVGTMSPPLSSTVQPTPSVTKPPCTNLNHNNYQGVIYPSSSLYTNDPQTDDPTEQIDPRRR